MQQYTDVLQHVWKHYSNVCTSLDLTVSDVSASCSPSCLNPFPWEGRHPRRKGQAGWKDSLSSGSFLPQAPAVPQGQGLKDYSCSSIGRQQSLAASPALHLVQVSPHHQLSHSQQKYGVCQAINICLSGDICVNVTKSAPKQGGKHNEEHVFFTKVLSDEHCSPVTVIAHKDSQLVVLQDTMGFMSVCGCKNSSCYSELTNLYSLRQGWAAGCSRGWVCAARCSAQCKPIWCKVFKLFCSATWLCHSIPSTSLHGETELGIAEMFSSWEGLCWETLQLVEGWKVKVAVPLVLGDILLHFVSECCEHCTSTSLLGK